MGLPEAKLAWQTIKTELAAMTNLYEKVDLLKTIRGYAEDQMRLTADAIKQAPAPAKLADLGVYYIADVNYNLYSVDKDGNLTKKG